MAREQGQNWTSLQRAPLEALAVEISEAEILSDLLFPEDSAAPQR